jgi:hypothetical protein
LTFVLIGGYLGRPDRSLRSGNPSVVIVQAAQDWNMSKLRQRWNDKRRRTRWDGNLAVDALMRTCTIEVPDILLDLTVQMMLT